MVASTYCSAQVSILEQNIQYMGETNVTISDSKVAPFWFANNHYGLSSVKGNSGYIRGTIKRNIEVDSLRKWKIGYGVDLVVPVNYTSNFVIQQLYGQFEYGKFKLTAGSKELSMEFNNQELSSGDMVIGINARPIPQIRIEIPEFWTVPGSKKWLGIKAVLSYGWYTDNKWQKDFTNKKTLYTSNSLFHNKALYLQVGNKKIFPLTFTGGLAFATQFGGEAWNVSKRADDPIGGVNYHINMDSGLKGYWNSLIIGGNDPNDGNYKNVEGNHVGSWHGSLKYQEKNWSVRGYFEHYFEDHSQLFIQYGWKDMTYGLEIELPDNPIASNLVIESISTKDQTGGIYHDASTTLPEQISGKDNYYNNHVYGGWQHWGMAIGNPLLISPIYNSNGTITFRHSRIKATHIGVAGNPTKKIHYRLLYTYMKSWGTYDSPLTDTQSNQYLLAELTYKPIKYKGWSATGAIGINKGDIIKNSLGMSFTLRKEGLLK